MSDECRIRQHQTSLPEHIILINTEKALFNVFFFFFFFYFPALKRTLKGYKSVIHGANGGHQETFCCVHFT